jgi:NAD(P)-dependent dehydrogenase (short-subunit alcohol dehydrogenase family)
MGPDRGRFEGRVGVVTGSGSGLGQAVARRFAREGGKVVVVDWVEEVANETVEMIAAEGGTALAYVGDVSEPAVCEDMIGAAVETYGGLDFLHNNVFGVVLGRTADIKFEDWKKTFAIMVDSYFLGTKYAIPRMLERGGGSIVNTSSVAGLTADPKFCAYSTCKHAIIGMTRAVSSDYAREGIRANAVCPGTMATNSFLQAFGETDEPSNTWFELATADGGPAPVPSEERMRMVREEFKKAHPVGDVADPNDVASVVLFLASDDARNVTGQAVVADGGMLALSGTPDMIFSD